MITLNENFWTQNEIIWRDFFATFGKNVLMLNVIMLIAECQIFSILSVILAPFLMSLPVNLFLRSAK